MIKISLEDREFVIKELENGNKLLEMEALRDILDELNDLELMKGYDGSFENGPNDFGREIERLIDRLYYDNQK